MASVPYELQDYVEAAEVKSLWVFGYGSLCWKPGFTFDRAVVGYVRGYSRRFWQGNSTHRGTKTLPGRVATLIEDEKGSVYGVSFAVSGEAALPYLNQRECTLGGYATHFTTFYPQAAGAVPIRVLLYIATPKNDLWLGDAPSTAIADQITACRGDSGHNAEYLLRLAAFMREYCPAELDEHLFGLEREVRAAVERKRLCLHALMGDGADCIEYVLMRLADAQRDEDDQGVPPPVQQWREDNVAVRADSFQFTSRVPEKALRCLNI